MSGDHPPAAIPHHSARTSPNRQLMAFPTSHIFLHPKASHPQPEEHEQGRFHPAFLPEVSQTVLALFPRSWPKLQDQHHHKVHSSHPHHHQSAKLVRSMHRMPVILLSCPDYELVRCHNEVNIQQLDHSDHRYFLQIGLQVESELLL